MSAHEIERLLYWFNRVHTGGIFTGLALSANPGSLTIEGHDVFTSHVRPLRQTFMTHPDFFVPHTIEQEPVIPPPDVPVSTMLLPKIKSHVSKLLGKRPGMGNPEKRPLWWPDSVCWNTKRINACAKRGEINMNKKEFVTAILAYYVHHGIELDVGGDIDHPLDIGSDATGDNQVEHVYVSDDQVVAEDATTQFQMPPPLNYMPDYLQDINSPLQTIDANSIQLNVSKSAK